MFREPFLRHALLGAASLLVVCPVAVCAQPADEQAYDLPAEDLGQALREVAARSGRNLIAPTQLIAGRRSAPLNGHYNPEAAVAALLAGTGLALRETPDALIVIAAAASEPPRQAEQGSASGRDTADIVVTGTHLRGTQPTSPLITISRKEIDRSGASSVEQLMRQVPQAFGGGVNQEVYAVAGVDITEHGAGINLRGLGQRATLVLLDGRRLAPSGVGSFVDVSLIPLTAIKRVEILTDGASAIYGSDAVGGVVNFILRDRFEGLETVAQAGKTTQGGGDELLAGATAGHAWSSGHAMLSYEYRREDEIRADQRDVTININPDRALFPRERRHSLLGVVGQTLGDSIDVEITGTFADRHTNRTDFITGVPLPIHVLANAQSTGLSGALTYDLGASWRAVLTGNYFVSRTDERQDQPGGDEFINSLDTRNALLEFGVNLDGSLFHLPAGNVRLAVGAQTRREDYRDLFLTQVSAPTMRAKDRVVHSLYGELYVPIVSHDNRRPGLERLLVTAAGRLEDYDAYPASFDPKFGVLWSPLEGLSFRASYDTSFRAPLLSETAGIYNAFYLPAASLFIDPAAAPPGPGLALVGSNPLVHPERSRTWTVGAEVRPASVPNLSLTLNYYSIRFSDRIALPTGQIVIVGDPALEAVVTRNPSLDLVNGILAGAAQVLDFSGPNFTSGGATPADVVLIVDDRYNNTAVTRTSGLDLTVSYGFEAGPNHFGIDLNANHIFSFEDQLTATSPTFDTLNTPYRPVSWRARGGVSWSRDGWSGSLFANYVGPYHDNRATVARRVDSFTTLDASLAYDFGSDAPRWLRGTRVGLTVQNLLDTDPPRLVPDPGRSSGLGYDPVNATARGRFIAVQVRTSW